MNHYYTPCAAVWYRTWQEHIQALKSNPGAAWAYSYAACIAQMNYVISLALKE